MGRVLQRMLAVTVGLALVVGCGGGDDSATAEPPTATTAPIAHVPLAIDEPDDAPVRARRKGSELIGRAPVSGDATPYSVLRVSSECPQAACTTGTTADENGRWRTAVRVAAPKGKPYARVTAQLSGESAVALMTLRLPGTKAPKGKPPKTKAKRNPTPSAASTGTRGGGAAAPGAVTDAPSSVPSTSSATGGSSLGGPGPIPAPTSGGTPTFMMIGDSLAEGTAGLLPARLPGWSVSSDGETGRSLRVGMERWAATRPSSPPTVAAFSLFTNDDPRNVASFEAAVRQTVEEPAGTCVVWATIVRPPVRGATYAAANAALERVAAAYPTRLAVVQWARAVQANPDWVRSDGVHATPEGYAARAQMYADAARACSGR